MSAAYTTGTTLLKVSGVNLALGLVAEIDTNADGYPELTVNLGTINTRTN
jgi:hypothetical protein